MQRVAVIGACGAGKSAFAWKLGAATALPVIHLDREYWLPGWREPELRVWRERHRALLNRREWIIDGNHFPVIAERLDRADTVIWLDYSPWLCRFGVVKRMVGWHGKVRADMAAGCPERLDAEFLRYVWDFHRDYHPRLRELTSSLRPEQRLIVIRRRSQARDLIAAASRTNPRTRETPHQTR